MIFKVFSDVDDSVILWTIAIGKVMLEPVHS